MRRKERGQVLILGLMALIILILAVFSLFDVQNLIRGKVKSQSGVDAAALTGANWQKHTLNLTGELNLIKASTFLIEESLFGTGQDPETFLQVENRTQAAAADAVDRKKILAQSSDLLSQMQYRILFLCPLIGVGAAQIAAKNNGLNPYDSFNEAVAMQNSILAGFDKRASLYDYFKQNEYCSKYLYGYQWHISYLNMLTVLLHQKGESGLGFAVMPSGDMLGAPSLYTDPPSDPDFSGYLGSKSFYHAIRGDDFCALMGFLLNDKFPARAWWGNIRVRQNTNFPKESEYLPVKVRIAPSAIEPYQWVTNNNVLEPLLERFEKNPPVPLGDHYDWRDPRYDSQGNVVTSDDSDDKLNPLPVIDWAYYKDSWEDYDAETVRQWKRFLRSGFKKEASYFSGAVSRMDAFFKPKLMFTNRGKGERHQVSASVRGIKTKRYINRIKQVENLMDSDPPSLHAYALAKPFGRLKIEREYRPPHHSVMVLPVFSDTALIPVALEDPGMNPLADYHWYLFLLNYMPALGKVFRLEDIPADLREEFSDYHALLMKADDPQWRQYGIDWLEKPIAWVKDEKTGIYRVVRRQKDDCDAWPSCSCCCGGRSVRNIPAAKF